MKIEHTDRFHLHPVLADKVQLVVNSTKVLASQDFETRNHSLARGVSSGLVGRRLRDLDLQSAFPKVQAEDLIDIVLHICFEDDIVTGDTEIDVTLSDERRDVRGGEENFDQSWHGHPRIATMTHNARL